MNDGSWSLQEGGSPNPRNPLFPHRRKMLGVVEGLQKAKYFILSCQRFNRRFSFHTVFLICAIHVPKAATSLIVFNKF